MHAELDHLVIVAHTLDQGVAWCEAALGFTPGPGGAHPLMGTHNRLFALAGAPRAYAEIIAIDPQAAVPGHARWFGMDDAGLRHAVRGEPRLVHFVARVPDVEAACAAWSAQQLDPGRPVPASRQTPRGLLQWQITVRADGQPQLHGALPTLIQWGDTHPADSMADVGARLSSLAAVSDDPLRLRRAYDGIGLQGVPVSAGTPALQAVLQTPRGTVTLNGGWNAWNR